MNPPPNNCPPLCGTHMDSEVDTLKSDLASARAVIAAKDEALEYVKESLEGRVGAEYVDRLDDLKLIDEALTAPASGGEKG